jgi:hypothetical protein
MKNLLKSVKATVLVLAFVSTTSLMAQGPGGFDDNVQDNDNTSVPVDGGLAVLIIGAAAALGVKKLRDNKK